MDELRRAADLLVADPPAPAATLEELTRRNDHRRNRRRVAVGVVALLVLVAGSLAVIAIQPEPEDRVITRPAVSSGRLAIATAHGVTLIDDRKGVVAELDLGFAPIHVSWSPDGQRLVAADGTDLWLIDRDGLRPRRLEDSGWDISWRGDHELVFTRGETVPGYRWWSRDGRLAEVDAEASVVVKRPNGTVERRLGPLPEAEGGGIVIHSWSPDARWIVYSAYPTASDSIAQDGVPLYAVRVADGFTFRIGVTLGHEGWLQWSPDGRRLLVVVGEGRFLTDPKVLRSCDLTVPRCDDLPSAPENVSTFAPAWSPDGREIAFIGRRGDADGGSHSLWVSAADGGAQRRAFEGFLPVPVRTVWTSDGGVLVVLVAVSDEEAVVVVERVPIHGGELRRRFAGVEVPVAMVQGGPAQAAPPIAWSPYAR